MNTLSYVWEIIITNSMLLVYLSKWDLLQLKRLLAFPSLFPQCIYFRNFLGLSLKIAKWNELKWDSMTLCWPSGRDTVPIHLRKLRRKGGTLWAIGIASQRSPLTNTPRGKSQIVIIPLLVYVPLKNIYKFIQSLLGGIIKFYGGIFPARYRQRAIYSKTASS